MTITRLTIEHFKVEKFDDENLNGKKSDRKNQTCEGLSLEILTANVLFKKI